MNNTNTHIDGFRFIDNLHTTARQLRIYTVIISLLSNRQLPKAILEQLITNWSILEEANNAEYAASKGKVTNGKKKTVALRYHLEISVFLGLTKNLNGIYTNTKISQAFLSLSKSDKNLSSSISLEEKLFYLFQLFNTDADGVILCLDQLADGGRKNQSILQLEFKGALNDRLSTKMRLTQTEIIRNSLSEKLRTINYIWKKPEKYAEHLIAPRYEWLNSLGVINIERNKNQTIYSISEKGLTLLNAIPKIGEHATFSDVTDEWISSCLFTAFNSIYPSKERTSYLKLPVSKQIIELGNCLEQANQVIKSSASFKMPFFETLFFICLDMFINKNIIINFKDISEKLEIVFTYRSKQYLLKKAGRLNESYITITLDR